MVFGRNGVSPPKFLSPVRLWEELSEVVLDVEVAIITRKNRKQGRI